MRREGWGINDLSPLSWQFFEISWPLGCFQKVKSFETDFFLFQETSDISTLISWNVRFFWIFVFRKRHVIAEIWLCFRACSSRIVTYEQEFCLVVWLMCFNHCYGIFWKVSLKKSWCCRKHVFVFEIVSLKGLDEFLIKLSFSLNCWVKDSFAIMERVLKTFPFWELTFFCFKRVKLLNLGGWLFLVEPLERS